MDKKVRIIVELNGERHMKVRGHYADYNTRTNSIKGFGEVLSSKYRIMEFEPTFEAVLFDKRNRICDMTTISYAGVFTKTGKMIFRFDFHDIPEFQVNYIKLILIAKKEVYRSLSPTENDVSSQYVKS